MEGWSFLQAGSFPQNLDGLLSAAIWANCWVGDDDGDLCTFSTCPTSSFLHSISSALGGASLAGDGGVLARGASSFSL